MVVFVVFDLVDITLLEVLDLRETSSDWNITRITGIVCAMMNTAASA